MFSIRTASMLAVGLYASIAAGQPLRDTSILVVTAHPDDEALFAGSIFRAAVELGGQVDLAVVTDGAGGFRYATLAERLYGLNLTDPDVAREYLPAIRKQELLSGGRMVGFRRYFFLDQPDTGKTTDPDSVLSTVWDSTYVLGRLTKILDEGQYNFLYTFLPQEGQHGHHKAAAILALHATRAFAGPDPPVVLGAWISDIGSTEPLTFEGLEGYPESQTISATSSFQFDRSRPLSGNDRLNYKIPVNWLISEHKSQGTMQLLVNRGDIEEYWLYGQNRSDALARARKYFDVLNDFDLPHSNEDVDSN